jgi:hypothetical protein
MTLQPSIDRAWIGSELAKGIDAERSLALDAKTRADSPPDAFLSILYHEIAAADQRHATIVETIAARYGQIPSEAIVGGIGRALGHLKNRVIGAGWEVCDQLIDDMAAKARSIHWHAAWVHALEAVGDSQSARELSAVLAEEESHRDALQQGLHRLVEQHARGVEEVKVQA